MGGFVNLIKNTLGMNNDKTQPIEEPEAFGSKEEAVAFVKREFERRQKIRRPVELQ
jgi:hypothetical protein